MFAWNLLGFNFNLYFSLWTPVTTHQTERACEAIFVTNVQLYWHFSAPVG